MKALRISAAQWQVMNLLWQRSPQTEGEIVAALETKCGWRPRTIRTLLERLVRKGALKALRDGKRRYLPKVTMEACARHESLSLMEKVFGGEPASMLLHLIKTTKLTRDEIQQLKDVLSEKEK